MYVKKSEQEKQADPFRSDSLRGIKKPYYIIFDGKPGEKNLHRDFGAVLNELGNRSHKILLVGENCTGFVRI